MPGNNQVYKQQTRSPGGKFAVQGAVGRAGRPPAVVETAYLKRLQALVSFEEWDAIATKAIEQAKNGDYRARQWLSDYCMGRPTAEATPYMDNRSVTFDLSNLSGPELTAAIELARLVNAPGGNGSEESG